VLSLRLLQFSGAILTEDVKDQTLQGIAAKNTELPKLSPTASNSAIKSGLISLSKHCAKLAAKEYARQMKSGITQKSAAFQT